MAKREQYGFVICVPLKKSPRWHAGLAREVAAKVDALGNPATKDVREALDATGCIHFMSMSVVTDPNSPGCEFLLMEVSGDGSRRMVIDALVQHAGKLLLPVFATIRPLQSLDDLKACFRRYFLRAKPSLLKVPGRATGLIFQGTPGLSVEEIKRDQEIEKIARESVIAMHRRQGREKSPLDYLEQARKDVSNRNYALEPFDPGSKGGASEQNVFAIGWSVILNSILVWVPLVLIPLCGVVAALFAFFDSDSNLPLALFFAALYLWVAAILAALSFVTIIAGIFGLLLWRLRHHERRDAPKDLDPDPAVVREIMSRENQRYEPGGPAIVQNHMMAVSTTKGWLFQHYVVLLLAMHVIKIIVTSGLFKPGYLSNIGTIHFAQWLRIPGTKKLLFFSNYDGSWESYLEDFITKASPGLTAVWSNTENFPKTNWLLFQGATDGDRFKRWARRQQIPTPFWYTAYPTLAATQIRTNEQVRQGLANPNMTQSEAEEWLGLFGSVPRPFFALETDEVQSLVFNALRDHLDSVCLLIRFPQEAAANAWLSEIVDGLDQDKRRVTFGDAEPGDPAMFLALSARGLARLGLRGVLAHEDGPRGPDPRAHVASFASAFTFGMADATRSRALGDTDGSAPEKWLWGSAHNPVDAALLIYAKTGQGAELPIVKASAEERERLERHGLEVVKTVTLKRFPESGPIREPFGFVDGLSQPVIKGTGRSAKGVSELHLVEPGEFILGYMDNRHRYPPTPHVSVALDGKRCLPNLPPDLSGLSGRSSNWRDFGRNGSFLVIRQLEQHVAEFNKFLREFAPEETRQEWLAAKMVGRWKNGAPLVRYPYAPPAHYEHKEDDNDFLFAQDDPQGLACPFGSHIRRANPRDNFDAGNPVQIAITNRHRMIRRGRVYVTGDDPEAKGEGLLFMCLNADIERQFEYVQQTWISSNTFGGLADETDPLTSTAAQGGNGCFTIPLASGPVRVEGLSSFVTIRGGAYFFLPSKSALRFLAHLHPQIAESVSAQATAV